MAREEIQEATGLQTPSMRYQGLSQLQPAGGQNPGPRGLRAKKAFLKNLKKKKRKKEKGENRRRKICEGELMRPTKAKMVTT